jgi:hypothetical protein
VAVVVSRCAVSQGSLFGRRRVFNAVCTLRGVMCWNHPLLWKMRCFIMSSKGRCIAVQEGMGIGEEGKSYLRVMIAPANPLPPSNRTPLPPADL